MKNSARNVFKGKVKQIEHGAVNSEVVIELPGGVEVVSIITKVDFVHFQVNNRRHKRADPGQSVELRPCRGQQHLSDN